MSETLMLALSLLAGGTLGAVFFGGLWWTVGRGLSGQHPALLFLGSMLARTALVVIGFYLVSDGHWQRLSLCLLGFLAARAVAMRLLRPAPGTGGEGGRAS